jgi:hypothetical protein
MHSDALETHTKLWAEWCHTARTFLGCLSVDSTCGQFGHPRSLRLVDSTCAHSTVRSSSELVAFGARRLRSSNAEEHHWLDQKVQRQAHFPMASSCTYDPPHTA